MIKTVNKSELGIEVADVVFVGKDVMAHLEEGCKDGLDLETKVLQDLNWYGVCEKKELNKVYKNMLENYFG